MSSKPGPKELQRRALREARAKDATPRAKRQGGRGNPAAPAAAKPLKAGDTITVRTRRVRGTFKVTATNIGRPRLKLTAKQRADRIREQTRKRVARFKARAKKRKRK